MLTHLDLFSGLGGFALAARESGFQTLAFVESDERCRTFLRKTYGLPVHEDIRTFDGSPYRGTTLLTGGPPCQPASRAGDQRGEADHRWLWEEALRVLAEVSPACVVFENPPGILDVGIDRILSEMARLGYSSQCFDIPACAVGSPQLRHRIWIVGFMVDTNERQRRACESLRTRGPSIGISTQVSLDLGDTDGRGLRAGTRQHNPTDGTGGKLADPTGPGLAGRYPESGSNGCPAERAADVADAQRKRHARSGQRRVRDGRAPDDRPNQTGNAVDGSSADVADVKCERRERRASASIQTEGGRAQPAVDRLLPDWSRYVWVPCADQYVRRSPDDSVCVVDGLHRSLLGALGNAIVPQVAREILKAVAQVL